MLSNPPIGRLFVCVMANHPPLFNNYDMIFFSDSRLNHDTYRPKSPRHRSPSYYRRLQRRCDLQSTKSEDIVIPKMETSCIANSADDEVVVPQDVEVNNSSDLLEDHEYENCNNDTKKEHDLS